MRVPLFRGLAEADRAALAPHLRLSVHAPRSTVFAEGSPGDSLFVVLSGLVKAVTVGSDGKELVLNVLRPGEVFGELSLLDGQPRSATVKVMHEETRLAGLERSVFHAVLVARPALAVRLLGALAGLTRRLTCRLERLTSGDVAARLAAELLEQAGQRGLETESARLSLRLSQQDLGGLIGASRESVNKQLRDWGEMNIVRREGRHLVIVDPPALRLAAMRSSERAQEDQAE